MKIFSHISSYFLYFSYLSYLSYLSLLLYSFFFSFLLFSFSSFSSADAITGSTDLQPQLLSEFPDGCYGTNPNFRTIFLNESKGATSQFAFNIGYIYLIKNPNFISNIETLGVPEYNVVLCNSNKLGDNGEHITDSPYYPLNHYFNNTFAGVSTDVPVSFLFDDNNGLFIVNKNGNNWLLSTSKGILFIRDEIRYSLLGFSVQENVKEGEVENSLRMLASLEFAMKDVTNNKAPQLNSSVASRIHYNKECNLRDVNSYCISILDARPVHGSKFSLYLFAEDDDKNNREETKVRKTEYNFILKEVGKNQLDTDNDGVSDEIEALLESDSEDGNEYPSSSELFDYFFEFDEETFTLQQKEGVDLTPDQSPYVIKVSIEEEALNVANVGDSILLAANTIPLNLYSELISQSGVVFDLYINVIEPSSYEATPATPKPKVVISSGRRGGGKDDTLLASTPKPTPKVLVCPTKKYNRYPENRGMGIAEGKFLDTSPRHRAYDALIDLAEQKIVNGDKETGNARLDDTISRAEFVKIMTIAREDTLLLGDCLKFSNFYDVDADAWYTPFIQNLEQKNIVKGYVDNMYRPARPINLVEAYKIISLSFDYTTIEEAYNIVHDKNIQWYVPYVDALEKGGVIPVWMKEYEMASTISRGDMFALLSNVLRKKDWLKNVEWK